MSPTRTATGIDGVKALVGETIGPSDWHVVTQEQVNTFAEATGDHQWIHVDPERAKRESPFGGAIAHGFLTLSMIPLFLPQLLAIEGFRLGVNYGLDRVRFPAPVPVGSKLRASTVIDDVADIEGGIQVRQTVTFEIEGGAKPVCVATSVVRHYV